MFSKKALINAPLRGRKRGGGENESKPLWQKLRESGNLPKKLAFYTPDDVAEIDDVDTLKKLYLAYSFTHSVNNRDTRDYMQYMSLVTLKKLINKDEFPPYIIETLHFKF